MDRRPWTCPGAFFFDQAASLPLALRSIVVVIITLVVVLIVVTSLFSILVTTAGESNESEKDGK